MPEKRIAEERERTNNPRETEIPASTMFYGEIAETDEERHTEGNTENIIDDTGKEAPANYFNDENWDEEK